jgi:hypothetical protein
MSRYYPSRRALPAVQLRLILRRHFVQYYGRPLFSSTVELCLEMCRPVHGFVRCCGTTRPYGSSCTASANTMPRPVLCYGQSYGQLSPALWLHRVRPLLYRTVLCHDFVRPMHMVRSYGYARSNGSVVSYLIQHHVVHHHRSMV